ncbi:ABC transporter permease [Ignatzschineria rhizosphaerae]|uniref:ABC transporter permease n=1 Tax=Ignatzschineria rhizosphaerae TaxID=2923279 RepID=A0ABY3X856_9GAMM|nr:FtsX-like permease family protein [Ignatzschineria rhizosphaerae]UNM97237.1 ABC transporter permease [Ignatzschineria rhizosphaerae]
MNKLSFVQLAALAFKQLMREIRAGELRILLVALLITVMISTAIGYFSTRLHASMEARAGEFLAADLVLRSNEDAADSQLKLAKDLGLEHAKTVNFSTVILNGDDLQLVSVKAADINYPLRGKLKIQDNLETPEYEVNEGPKVGEVWVESRLLYGLNLHVGDVIDIGKQSLKITKIITYAPDRSANFYSFNPFALMNREDLAATGAVQKGSRVTYRHLWAGDMAQIKELQPALKKTLMPNQKILTIADGSKEVSGALNRAQNYLNLASLVGILLASVAIALSANQFANNRYDASALLRSLGMQQKQVLWLYGFELFYVSIIGAVLGAILGWLAQLGLFVLLKDLISTELPSGGVMPAIAGVATGFTVLIGFALPPLAALGRTPPLRVLREDLLPTPLKSFVVYGIALLALFLIMWQLSLNISLTLALLGGAILMVILLGTALYFSVRFLRRVLSRASFVWRMALGQTLRNPVKSMGQIVAFGVILMTMALVMMLRGELLQTWQDQLPPDAPNYFAMNIMEEDRAPFREHVATLSPNISPFYPMVAGRLTAINEIPVRKRAFNNERAENATKRDLNLTWSADLPAENKLVEGEWWQENSKEMSVSLEEDLAKGLNVQLGDMLTFVIAGESYTAKLTSIRHVNWDTVQPNFFVMFNPESIVGVPVTYLTSFYLPANMQKELMTLAREFPTITLLDLMAIVNQLNEILQQVTLAVEYILALVLLAGLIVLIAGLQATLSDRLRQGAILRVLGANRKMLFKSQLIEFALMGGLAGLLAMIGSEFISFLLYRFVLNLEWQLHPWLILLPLIGALLISLLGIIGTRRVVLVSPLLVLRR